MYFSSFVHLDQSNCHSADSDFFGQEMFPNRVFHFSNFRPQNLKFLGSAWRVSSLWAWSRQMVWRKSPRIWVTATNQSYSSEMEDMSRQLRSIKDIISSRNCVFISYIFLILKKGNKFMFIDIYVILQSRFLKFLRYVYASLKAMQVWGI